MTTSDHGKRYILLDPFEDDSGWVSVIVAAPTGVVYQVQGGGVTCRQFEQEGYLIPILGRGLDEDLKAIFIGDLKGQGSRDLDWPDDLLDRLRDAVALNVYCSANRDDLFPDLLSLDESRLAEADEAWIPVRTPDGPGVLVWGNSD